METHPQFKAVLKLVGTDAAILQKNDGTLRIEPHSPQARQRVQERIANSGVEVHWSLGYGTIC